jgi:hypothetical protein
MSGGNFNRHIGSAALDCQQMMCRALFWVQQGALIEARLPGGHLQYRRAQKFPSGTSGEVICEDPEDDDIVPTRRQQAEPENDCKVFLDVRCLTLLVRGMCCSRGKSPQRSEYAVLKYYCWCS